MYRPTDTQLGLTFQRVFKVNYMWCEQFHAETTENKVQKLKKKNQKNKEKINGEINYKVTPKHVLEINKRTIDFITLCCTYNISIKAHSNNEIIAK